MIEENKKDVYKIILLGISIILLITFAIISNNIKKNNESDTYSKPNSVDENNLKKIPGYSNLYYYEIDLETY